MAIGVRHVIHIHENDDGVVIFDSVIAKPFTHDNTFTSMTTDVKKEDFTGTNNDAFLVSFSYPEGSEPDLTSVTVDDLRVMAADAVNTFFGGLEADPSAA